MIIEPAPFNLESDRLYDSVIPDLVLAINKQISYRPEKRQTPAMKSTQSMRLPDFTEYEQGYILPATY
ncbi:MAG: hypothetical protein ABI477_03130 [Chryseolinea sp.]